MSIRHAITGVCLLLPVVDSVRLASGNETEARFAAAQRAFEAAQQLTEESSVDNVEIRRAFFQAAEAFAALADDGVRSRNLYVNAGNAYYVAGNPGRALLWYLRANRLRSTSQTRGGVARVRRLCGVELWPESQGSIGRVLMFWHYDLQRLTKQRVFMIAFALGCAMLLVWVFISRGRRVLLRAGLVIALVGMTLGVSDLMMTLFPPPARAVVVESESGRSGDGDSYSIIVDDIPAGQEVDVIETRQDWVEVTLPSGATCWLPSSVLEKV